MVYLYHSVLMFQQNIFTFFLHTPSKGGRTRGLQVLKQKNYTHMLMQIGRGKKEPQKPVVDSSSLETDFYRYKDSIADDIKSADLVICHAGMTPM